MINEFSDTTIKQKAYIIIDAGGTYLKSAVLNGDGFVYELSRFNAESHSGNDSREKIIWAFEESVARGLRFIGEKDMETGGVGIAMPGPFDYRNGISLMKHKFQSLYEMNLKDLIVEATGISPDMPFTFIHDANAVLYGEQWLGNAMDFAHAAVVTIGTGLGFTYSQNGTVQCNDLGSPLVSIYNTQYGQGTLEDYVSRRGILKNYGETVENETAGNLEVSDIAKLADEGDVTAFETFCETGRILSKALSDILIEKNIECLLFSGQISRSFHLMESTIKEGLKEVGSLKRILPVKSIDNAAFYGVLWNVNKVNSQINPKISINHNHN
jgi:glucokinase